MRLKKLFCAAAVLSTFLNLAPSDAAPPAKGNHHRSAAGARPIYMPSSISSDNYVADMEHAHFWSPRRMPLKVFIHECSDVPQFDPAFVDAFKGACTEWEEATGRRLTFTYTDKLEEADIDVKWTKNRDGWCERPGGEIGVTVSQSSSGGLLHASIMILTNWVERKGAQFTPEAMKSTCLHELGHSFGLGHSSKELDIMYPSAGVTVGERSGRVELSSSAPRMISGRDATSLMVIYAARAKMDEIYDKGFDNERICAELINESVRQNSRGDYAQAIVFLNEVLYLDPNSRTAMSNLMAIYYNCGVSKYNRHEYAEAILPITKAIELSKRIGMVPRAREMAFVRDNCRRLLRPGGGS